MSSSFSMMKDDSRHPQYSGGEFPRSLFGTYSETPLSSYVAPKIGKDQSISALRFDSIWDEEIRLLDGWEKKFARIRCKALGNDRKGNPLRRSNEDITEEG
jgi:hypothetical protein